MNNSNSLDYTIETTLKNNKLQIEYKGKVFKENPALVNKNTSKVKVMETTDGFIVELDVKKEDNLSFSINNINNTKIINKQENKYKDELAKITDLTVIDKMSLWKRFVHYIHKLAQSKSKDLQEDLNK